MPGRRSLVERVKELENARRQLTARLSRERARLRSEERRREARQRFVVGRAVLQTLYSPTPTGAMVHQLLMQILSPDEQKLVGLIDNSNSGLAESDLS